VASIQVIDFVCSQLNPGDTHAKGIPISPVAPRLLALGVYSLS
jgi:hypothetical protein